MNTTHPVTLPPARADELAGLLDGLLDWLTAGDPSALANLEHHLGWHATIGGGTFDDVDYLSEEDSILETFTTLIAVYVAELDPPDHDGVDW